MRVTVAINTGPVVKALNAQAADMKWVHQNLVNDLLKGARAEQELVMRQNFTIRNEAFLKFSLKISKFASRSVPIGMLGMEDVGGKPTGQMWARFERGGVKQPRGSKNIAVPTDKAWGNRGRPLPKRNRPRNLARSFVVNSGGKKFILARTGRKTRKQGDGTDANVKIMYNLSPTVRIPDKLHFYATTLPYIRQHTDSTFSRLMAISLARNGLK